VSRFDEYVELLRAAVEKEKAQGAVGLKLHGWEVGERDDETARSLFAKLLDRGELDSGEGDMLCRQLYHAVARLAGETGMVMCIHTGIIWNNWNDFHREHPRHVIPLLRACRATVFDVYHAGIPWTGTVGVMAKTFPNMNVNLCWCHVVSQAMTVRALEEWLDLVPTSKIIGFGGDYDLPVEKVWGHLVMAREDIARALAARVADGRMSEKEAVGLARAFLFDNPRRIYGLDV
jgi:predicted TIM-barrel fold metal-dependent hydrolase